MPVRSYDLLSHTGTYGVFAWKEYGCNQPTASSAGVAPHHEIIPWGGAASASRAAASSYGMSSCTANFVEDRGDLPADVNDHKGTVETLHTNRSRVIRLHKYRGLEYRSGAGVKLVRWVCSRYKTLIFVTENGTTVIKGETLPKHQR